MRRQSAKGVCVNSLLGAASSLVFVALQAPACAQTGATAGSSTAVAEVIVTAEKREESALKVPLSLSVQSQAQLAKEGVVTFTDLISQVPGVSVEDSGGGGVRPIIRGVASFEGDPTVAIYIDDAAIQSQAGYDGAATGGSPEVNLLDVERVEVLRGPQGTLYGGSSMGGAIRYIMKRPSLQGSDLTLHEEGALVAGGSQDGEFSFAGGLTLIPDTLGLRVSGSISHQGGYIDQVDPITHALIAKNINDHTTEGGRVAVRLDPTPGLSLLAAVVFQREDYGGFDTFDSALGYPKMDLALREPGSDQFVLPSLTITEHLGQLEITSATAYFDRLRRGDNDFTELFINQIPAFAGLAPINDFAHETTKIFTQELRVRYDLASGRAGILVGGYYFSGKLGQGQFTSSLAGPGTLLFGETTTTTEHQASVFGEAYWRPLRPLKVTLGLRASRITEFLNRPAGQGPFADPTATGSHSESPVTPKVNVSYDLGANGLIYAQAAKGYRAGRAEGAVPNICDAEITARGLTIQPGFSSDSLWTYEVGGKGLAADGAISFSGSLYKTRWRNKPEPVLLKSCGSTLDFNIGQVDITGAEFETTFRPIHSLTFSANVGYTDAKYTKDEPTAGFVTGDALPFVPRWTAAASAEYDFDAHGWPAFARVDYIFRDRSPQGSTEACCRNTAADFSDRYSIVNLRLGVGLKTWNVALFANNVTNRHPLVSAFFWHPGTLDADRDTTLAPRTVGVSLTTSY